MFDGYVRPRNVTLMGFVYFILYDSRINDQHERFDGGRREKYTKKFYRKKKLYDIMKERGKKAVREATWTNR